MQLQIKTPIAHQKTKIIPWKSQISFKLSQYSECPATGHLDTGFSWFPYVYKRILRWFPRFQVATTCFSCSPPDLNVNLLAKCKFISNQFRIFVYMLNNHCHRVTAQLQLINIIIIYIINIIIYIRMRARVCVTKYKQHGIILYNVIK
jgi:hypothetical protein